MGMICNAERNMETDTAAMRAWDQRYSWTHWEWYRPLLFVFVYQSFLSQGSFALSMYLSEHVQSNSLLEGGSC